MKNTINRFRITAFIVMVIGLSTAAYAQKSIVVTGIPNTYKGKTGMLALAPSANSQNYIAYSLVIIDGPTVKFPLSDWTTDKPWNGGGNFAFVLLIGENAQAISKKQYTFLGQTPALANVKQESTTVPWAQFVGQGLGPGPGPGPMEEVKQKSITIAGVPNNYKGKTGVLYLAPSANNQNYVAYSTVIINGTSITFPLSDLKNDKPWVDNGNFVFILMIGDNMQAMQKKQYQYIGQTTDTTPVRQDATTIQWSQFVSPSDAKQKSIVITGVPNNYKGKTAMLALAPSANNQNYTSYSLVVINGASVTFPLSDFTTDKPWTGNGNFAFVILIGENAQAITKKQYLYQGQITDTVNIRQDATTIQWSSFVSLAAPEVKQKSITMTGIPSNYNGKIGMIVMAPSNDDQNYTAYSTVTMAVPSTTFPLLDWTTDESWGGSGNFVFVLMIGETEQAIATDKYLYLAQSNDATNITQETTTLKWAQFAFVRQQQFRKPSRRSNSRQSAAPAAPTFGGYIITGSGTAFSATKNGASVGTAGQLKNVITAIRANAAGQPCEIRFGDGVTALDIGEEKLAFDNRGGTWGPVNISGKITSSTDYFNGVIEISSGISVTSTAEITNTNTTARAVNTVGIAENATFTIAGGKIATLGSNSSSRAVYNISSGTVNMTGGAVEGVGSGSVGISNFGSGTINISGGTVTASANGHAVSNNAFGSGTINISGGTVTASANGYAVSNNAKGIINVSGGTIDAGKDGKSAVYNSSSGKIIVSGAANITSSNQADGTAAILMANASGTDVRLEMTGGTVRNTVRGGTAIRNESKAAINISGGTVSAPNGVAINNRGELTTSGARIEGRTTP